MNNKVTFQELVDAIAEQSGKSKQFTHDFIKDLVSIIQESLEKDGNINIAGLGKFELKKIDEREGFNPQTEEKITIPAHNKIDFTPYKDLRELVNAPYSHMEPEIIEEDPSEDIEDQDEPDSTAPAGAEDADEKSEKKKAPWEEDMESELDVDEEDPFGLNAKLTGRPSFSFEEDTDDGDDDKEGDDEDVVEFTPGLETETEEETEKEEIPETDEPSGEATPSVPEEVEEDEAEEEVEEKGEVKDETAATIPPADDIDETSGESEEQREPEQPAREEQAETKSEFTPKSTLSFRDRRHRKRDAGGGSTFWIIAAAFIILLLAIGAWYFMGAQQGSSPDSMDTPSAQTESPTDDQQESTQAAESQQEQQQEQEEEQEADQSSPDDTQQPASGQQQADPGQQSTQPDDPPPVETITVARGQTLWGLADNHYENPYLWPWIYDTNKASIDNPDIIVIGQSLDIPLRRGSNDSLSENDSLQVALGYVETYKWYKENNLENAKFYLFAAKKYHSRVFEYTDEEFDEVDLAFANRAQ